MSDEDVFYLAQMFHEAAPTEGLGGDRPYGTPTEVIQIAATAGDAVDEATEREEPNA